ncbi:MAG: FG-GAP-like repeat-containing protein [Haloarculaceae archaeon]
MRTATAVAVVLILVLFGGAAVLGLTVLDGGSSSLAVEWVSETGRPAEINHHAPAAGRIDGQGMVFAPVSGRANQGGCALVALDGASGERRWEYPIPAQNCTIHSVADPTLADFDGDGTTEVVATTTEKTVEAFDPQTGDVEFRHNLTSYGYTQPLVTDFLGDDRLEIVVVDVHGTVFVVEPDGTTVWKRHLDSYTWGQPAVADFDGDGTPELTVATGDTGKVYLFEQNGSDAWSQTPSYEGSITWMTTGDADADGSADIVVATASTGLVSMVDGATGQRQWTRDFGSFAAVHAFGDGDGDGEAEVYAVAKDGKLRCLDAATGETEWTTTLTTESVQMTPPPALGDLDGDGKPELVAVTNDGVVSVVDPVSGEVLDTYERESAIFTNPRLADIDGDGDLEAFVMFGRGRVAAFDFSRPSAE